MSKMRLKKSKVIVEPSDGQQSRFFYNIMEIIHKKKEGTVPVPSLYLPMRLAIVSITCSGVIAIGGFKSGGGKPKEKAPWDVMIRS